MRIDDGVRSLMLVPFVAIVALAPLAIAASDAPLASCAITFTGTSSLHDFEGTMPAVSATLQQASTDRWNSEVVVPVSSMTTDNGSRDAKMRDMLNAERFPDIRATFRDIDPRTARDAHTLAGSLTIAGTTHEFTAKLENWQEQGSRISFDAASDVSLSNFGLVAPSVLGLVRVGDVVAVRAHVSVEAGDAVKALAVPQSAPTAP